MVQKASHQGLVPCHHEIHCARHVESVNPHVRLHSLWRLGSVGHPASINSQAMQALRNVQRHAVSPCEVVLTWRFLVQSWCEDEDQADGMGWLSTNITSVFSSYLLGHQGSKAMTPTGWPDATVAVCFSVVYLESLVVSQR